MKQKRYSDEQIAFALRQAESGTAVADLPQAGRVGADLLPMEESVHRDKRDGSGNSDSLISGFSA